MPNYVVSDCLIIAIYIYIYIEREREREREREIKNRKAAGLDEIPSEVWKTRQFDDILLRHCNDEYN